MSFSLLLWLMGPSLVPSYSVSVIDFFNIVLHSYRGFRCNLWYNALRVCHIFIFWLMVKINDPYSSMHHTKLPAYLREQKKYHLAHHYKNFELGFGVTSMSFLLVTVLSSDIWFQAKFGTTCLTPCFHFKYGTIPYSFPFHVVFYIKFDYQTQRILLIYVVIDFIGHPITWGPPSRWLRGTALKSVTLSGSCRVSVNVQPRPV